MKEEKQKDNQPNPAKMAFPGHGPDGVDKAPGEETSEDNIQFVQQSQKGKKVDADPFLESDNPLDKQDL